ncbi:MAG: endonuclease [Crocinitomicaceae bacterium]|nr:endonuclease [Crocinitomicaceae bacterium]
MKKVVLILTAFFFVIGAMAQTDIADGRTYGIGQTITVTGVATNGSELGSIRYMQDATAGIAGYGGPITGVNRGDSITVTGPLIEFAGLLEISIVTTVVNHGPTTMPTPLQIPITSAGESLESQLIEVQNVTFVETGNFAGNTNYTLTDGVNNLQLRVNNGTAMVGTAIPTGTVTVTGLMGQYNADYQIIPRDLNDIIVYVAPAFEINLLLEGLTELNNADYFYGNASTINATIENLGTQDLIVSNLMFTGPNAGEFSSTYSGSTVGPLSNVNFTIDIAPLGNGSLFAAMEIASNDADENPYIINFEGVGLDNLATEPTANATNMTFPIIEAYTLGAQYTAGSGNTDYIVLWKNGSAITGVPVDGTSYLRGDVVGDARVAYVGAGTSFTPRGIIANQDYYFAVYAFNGAGSFVNYLTTSPATGTESSLGEQIGSYYSGISAGSPTLVSELNSLINPHTMISYFMYKQTMMSDFEIRDTTGGQSYVTCAYSGERLVFDDPFDWTATGYSREHTYAHSWMATWPADSPEQPEYTDQHNLYPTNLAGANSPRSNLPLGEIVGAPVFTYLEGSVGNDGTQMVYEPRDAQKGNAARAILYMAIAYDFPLSGDLDADKQDEQLLRDWHFTDLPDDYEIARNEYIFDLQGNRNPFIDSTDFVCYINFDDNLHRPLGCIVSLEEQVQNNLVVYPVPAAENVFIQVNGTTINKLVIVDMQGRVVSTMEDMDAPLIEIDTKKYEAGSYIVRVETPYGNAQKSMVIK